MVRGLSAIDGRTLAAQALIAWRNQLLTDLGGEESVSAQQSALVELAARTRLYIDHLDAFLLEQESLVNKRKKALLPVVRERQALVDSLARILGELGLERRAKPVKSLHEYLAEKAASLDAQGDEGAAGRPNHSPAGQSCEPYASAGGLQNPRTVEWSHETELGKYAGRELAAIPTGYLTWLPGRCRRTVRDIKAELEVRP
jgi:hypothetical protein